MKMPLSGIEIVDKGDTAHATSPEFISKLLHCPVDRYTGLRGLSFPLTSFFFVSDSSSPTPKSSFAGVRTRLKKKKKKRERKET